MKRCFAPRAILIPISFVRSSTTTFMMFETPMPPTTSVSEPTMPRNPVNASMKMSKNLNCPVVSHTERASLSFGSNFFRLPRISRIARLERLRVEADVAWKMKLFTYFSPVSARYVVPGIEALSLSRPL